MVYIAEAHALSEWPVTSARFNRGKGPVLIQEQPATADDRCDLARKFAKHFEMSLERNKNNHVQLVVDDPEQGDPFEQEYAPWPLRLYLIKDQKLEWIAQPKDCSYDEALQELLVRLGMR